MNKRNLNDYMNKIRKSLFVLIDKKKKLILQHRDKYAVHPNIWGFFGGGIEKNETPEEAVRREAKEELQIELEDLKLFKKYEYKKSSEFREYFVFIASLKHSVKDLKKQQKEGDDLGLFSFKDLKNLKLSERGRGILRDLFDKKV